MKNEQPEREASLCPNHAHPYGQSPDRAKTGFAFVTAKAVDRLQARVLELEEGLAQAVHYLTYDGHPEGQPGNPGWKLQELLGPGDHWSAVEKLEVVVMDDSVAQIQTPAGLVVRRFCPDPDSWHEFEYGGRVWDGHWLEEDGQVTFEVFETFVNSHGERHSDVGKSALLHVL